MSLDNKVALGQVYHRVLRFSPTNYNPNNAPVFRFTRVQSTQYKLDNVNFSKQNSIKQTIVWSRVDHKVHFQYVVYRNLPVQVAERSKA